MITSPADGPERRSTGVVGGDGRHAVDGFTPSASRDLHQRRPNFQNTAARAAKASTITPTATNPRVCEPFRL